MKRTALIVIPLVVVFAALGIGLTKHLVRTATPAGTAAEEESPITTGGGVKIQLSDKPVAVPVEAARLADINGHILSMDSYRGKVVLLNFWATWCGPCREEIPALMALQEHYRNRLVVVGLSIDDRPVSEVAAFVQQMGMNYPVLIASAEVQRAFGGIPSIPATFVVNPEGKIVVRHLGSIDPQRVEHEVRALSGLSTAATVEVIKDTGQVLLANAAYATEIPGVDLKGMTPAQKAEALKRLNTEHCTCGCNTTLAQCRINDPSCTTSLPLAEKVAAEVRHAR